MIERLIDEWKALILESKSSPYVFRTRLERIIHHTKRYTEVNNDKILEKKCNEILEKLKYISDQSNQTSDGHLNSFVILKDNIIFIKNYLIKLEKSC